jgi:serine phosphatase RsbU (regulator of sigma subunit)/anti-sigma regulatory factor (Ser/Thr protein kinase)
MVNIIHSLRSIFGGRPASRNEEVASNDLPRASTFEFDLDPDDPLVDYLQQNPGVTQVEKIDLDSPALRRLKMLDIKLLAPLVSQGELIGLLNLGPRLSEQEYSGDDIALLNNLAAQATPAVRVAQLVQQQQAEAQERERIEQELRVAHLIQQTLLPRENPRLEGWSVETYYQPARAVGGDFYDFIKLPEGRLGIFTGDVTDKGVPAALVMATTRRILRFAAEQFAAPGDVLEHANDLLCPDIPANMFVTCLYAVLDPQSGSIRYANAGHNPPYCITQGQVSELRATGMPLGLIPGMKYEEKEAVIQPGGSVLFYSDGLVEAHNPNREMFSFGRVKTHMDTPPGEKGLIPHMLAELQAFTGPDWEQEDDVTLMTLQRDLRHRLAVFEVPSQPGNERLVLDQVAPLAVQAGLAASRVEKVKTAVAEAAMNAMEHGNAFTADKPIHVEVWCGPDQFSVRITDQGGSQPIPAEVHPDLEAKLSGEQNPRGWGLFLIKNMVDELKVTGDDLHHTIELGFSLEGAQP